jgi:Na+/phosphate symporter
MLDKIKSDMKYDEEDDMIYRNYETIRETIKGIIDIFEIKIANDDFFYQAGVENLRALHESVIDILELYNSPIKIQKMIEEIRYKENQLTNKKGF